MLSTDWKLHFNSEVLKCGGKKAILEYTNADLVHKSANKMANREVTESCSKYLSEELIAQADN